MCVLILKEAISSILIPQCDILLQCLTEFFDLEVWPLHSTLTGQITIQENKSETISAMLLLMDLYIVKHNVLQILKK